MTSTETKPRNFKTLTPPRRGRRPGDRWRREGTGPEHVYAIDDEGVGRWVPVAQESREPRRRIKLQAVQPMFYDDDGRGGRVIAEGEVFWYSAAKLPADDIAVEVDPATPCGIQPPDEPGKDAPPWTTKGHVDRANRSVGSRDMAG